MTADSSCEVYNINENKWISLANLPIPVFSLSLAIMNSTHLLAVGGTDDKKISLTTMFTLDITNENSKWERLTASLPVPISFVGLW